MDLFGQNVESHGNARYKQKNQQAGKLNSETPIFLARPRDVTVLFSCRAVVNLRAKFTQLQHIAQESSSVLTELSPCYRYPGPFAAVTVQLALARGHHVALRDSGTHLNFLGAAAVYLSRSAKVIGSRSISQAGSLSSTSC